MSCKCDRCRSAVPAVPASPAVPKAKPAPPVRLPEVTTEQDFDEVFGSFYGEMASTSLNQID
jgi:hypothetical protein